MEGSFRICSKGWFLTYPRCALSKEEARDLLKAKGKDIKQMVVAREHHADGTPHLHVYVKLGSEFNCRNARFWDLDSSHGNYQSAKSLLAVMKYVTKGGDYLEEGVDVENYATARKDRTSQAAIRVMAGEPLDAIAEEFPFLFPQLPRWQQALAVYKGLKAPTLPRCEGFIPNSFGLITPLLSSKQRHYWFWSTQPNKGKTTFLQDIQSKFPCLWYSWVEKFQASTPFAQFVLLDEYSTGHLTVTQLNSMCDGTYQYPVKGGPSFCPPLPILLVCGNRSPLDVYPQEIHHPLIKSRFVIHCLDV